MSSQAGPGFPGVSAWVATILAGIVGLALVGHSAWISSATYDEVTYLKTAAHWWRTGEQSPISRMGSPVTFWKIQQSLPMSWLDASGHGDWIDRPIENQSSLLRVVRLGSIWIWLTAFCVTVLWCLQRHGPRAMAFAAWLFALSPNLIAHGGLVTMEMPLVAASAGLWASFDVFLRTGRRRWFVVAAACSALAFACKYSAVLYPPILGLAWWWCVAEGESRRSLRRTMRISLAMAGFGVLMIAADLVVTGFARLPLSEQVGTHPFLDRRYGKTLASFAEWPWPVDWVGFLTQLKHQRGGGPSYLFGQVRSIGWWYYYPVALAVKTPVALALLCLLRLTTRKRDVFPVVVACGFLALAMLLSKRNYGFRYLLPLAPLAIAWLSSMVEKRSIQAFGAWVLLGGYVLAIASVHPHELSYFNRLAGGSQGGSRILADSNLDWGQGLRGFAELQGREPRFRDLTLYYFGDTDPRHYGVTGVLYLVTANEESNRLLPPRLKAETRYLAVSTSLVAGPWGPPGYFQAVARSRPILITRDGTIRIYEVSSLGYAD